MALFKRSKQKSVLPEEVSQYYQSQRRERTGVAVMLGLIALVVTLLIGAGLFYGGRFAYRQFASDDKPATTTTENTNNGDQTPVSDDNNSSPETLPGGDAETTPESNDSSNTNADSTDTTTSTKPQTTPALGDDTELPHTGDPGM